MCLKFSTGEIFDSTPPVPTGFNTSTTPLLDFIFLLQFSNLQENTLDELKRYKSLFTIFFPIHFTIFYFLSLVWMKKFYKLYFHL